MGQLQKRSKNRQIRRENVKNDMKQVPFVANSEDNMHCVNAVFRMVHRFYFHKDLSWRQIDTLTKAVPGKATWTFIGEMEFAKKGLKVINIEPIDYEKLFKEGVGYFKKVLGKDTAEYYLKKTNIETVFQFIPEYLSIIKHETRRPSTDEIIGYLKHGSLIGVEVNSRILNHRPGFELHFILLYDFDGRDIIFHDPGLPPIKARKITLDEFNACFNYKGANAGMTVFSK